MSELTVEPYAAAVRKLLRGVVYHDDPVWIQIRDYELPIREYLGKIGLGMHLDGIGNFAYLYDMSRTEDAQGGLPALTGRRELSFSDSLLLVLLRERLDEHEMRDLDGVSLLLTLEELLAMAQVFTQGYRDARKVEASLTTSIKRLENFGFLTRRRDGRYEVRPLIRAKISADELEGIKTRLTAFVGRADTDETMGDDDGESV
jgi:hypothetical protein